MVNKEINTNISRDVEKLHENLHAIQKFQDLGVSRLPLGIPLIFQNMLFLHLFCQHIGKKLWKCITGLSLSLSLFLTICCPSFSQL